MTPSGVRGPGLTGVRAWPLQPPSLARANRPGKSVPVDTDRERPFLVLLPAAWPQGRFPSGPAEERDLSTGSSVSRPSEQRPRACESCWGLGGCRQVTDQGRWPRGCPPAGAGVRGGMRQAWGRPPKLQTPQTPWQRRGEPSTAPSLTPLPQAHLLRPGALAGAGAGGACPLPHLVAPDLSFLLIYTLIHKGFEEMVGKDRGDENTVHCVFPF